MEDLRALMSPAGRALLDALPPLASTSDALREVSRLRAAGHDPGLVSAVIGQAQLRHRAATKFGPRAAEMLFTRAGLEQATRGSVAARHAARMRAAGIRRVLDLGCGIGGDAIHFADAGMHVTAVDDDEVTAAIASHNLAPFGARVDVRHQTAQEAAATQRVEEDGAVWLDPARRTAGHGETRRVHADDYSPPLDWVFTLASRTSAGVKLGPAHDREALPDDAEAQWISAGGTVVELVVWTGRLRRPGIARSALVLRGGEAHELTAASDSDDAPLRTLGAYLHEPDGAVIRARLIGDLARHLNAGMLDPRIAYMTSDDATTSDFAQSFRIRTVLPMKVPAIKAVLRAEGIGIVEIKKRGVDIDPSQFRRALALRGSGAAVLVLTRIGEKRLAILADRV